MQLYLTFGTAMREMLIHLSPNVLAKCMYVPLRKFLLYLMNAAVYLRVFFFGLLAVLNTHILQYVSIPVVSLLWLSRIAQKTAKLLPRLQVHNRVKKKNASNIQKMNIP